MTELNTHALLQQLDEKGLLTERPKAETMLLCQENLPQPSPWPFWVGFGIWIVLWLVMGSLVVRFFKTDLAYYGFILFQMIVISMLITWPRKSYRFDPLLSATILILGLSSFIFLLPIPIDPWVLLGINMTAALLFNLVMVVKLPHFRETHPLILSAFCLAALLIGFLTSPMMVYSLILIVMGMGNRKLWLSLIGVGCLVVSLVDLSYLLPFSLKVISLLFVLSGSILMIVPFFWHKSAKHAPSQKSPLPEN